MIVRYINSAGQEVNLNKMPYRMLVSDLLDYQPEVAKSNGKICGFNNDIIAEHELNIDVHRRNETSARITMNELTDIFNTDVAAAIPGKLYINDTYKNCYIYARDTDRWGTDIVISCSYKVISDSLSWIQELTKQFLPQTTVNATRGLNYPFDYPFNYAPSKVGLATWEIDHYTSSHFLMRIYGPCVDPKVFINNYPYQVFTTLEAGDYLEIDTRNNTVIKYLANGTTQNCYNSRQFTPSIFEKIPPGSLRFSWPGNFGFDMTVFIERSEPKWDTSEKTYIVTESGRRMVTE